MGQQIHSRVPFHFICQEKSCQGGFIWFYQDAWGKIMGFKASDLCFVNTALWTRWVCVLLTPCVLNLRTNQISIGIGQPFTSLTMSKYLVLTVTFANWNEISERIGVCWWSWRRVRRKYCWDHKAIRSEVSFRFSVEQWNSRHFALLARCKWCEGLADADWLGRMIRSQI